MLPIMANERKNPETETPEEKPHGIFADLFPVFSIRIARKRFHIGKAEFKAVQDSTSLHMSFVSFVASAAGILIGFLLLLFVLLGVWNDSNSNDYSHVAVFVLIGGCALALLLLGLGFLSKRESARQIEMAIGDILFHLAIGLSSIFFFLADLYGGELNVADAVTPAIMLGMVLVLCQPGHWQSAVIVNLAYASSVLTVSLIGANTMGMLALDMYIVYCVAFLIACYFTYCAYTYAECQRYFIANANSELLYSSTHDPLTRARNRAGLRLYLDDQIKMWKIHQQGVLVIMFDIDDFKQYNDTFGHPEGDKVLLEIVQAFERIDVDFNFELFRYGGEEFLLIVEEATKDTAYPIMETIRKRIEDLNIPAPRGAAYDHLTISLGGSFITVDETYSFSSHVADADAALYKAKKDKKNQSVLRFHSISEKSF